MTGATLAVLAGGEGSRMGRPKGLLRVHGRPVLEYLLDRFEWTGPTLLVTAPGREHPPGWERFTREVQDPVAGLGPLRGILTALEAAETPLVVVASVDMPGVGREQLDWLVSRMQGQPEALGVMCHRATGSRPLVEPFPSVYRVEAAPVVSEQLNARRRAPHALTDLSGFVLATAPSEWRESVWTNLNTPDDLSQLGGVC
jgi:molybdopterin-guanine dinucleotide biosynthesis protein A